MNRSGSSELQDEVGVGPFWDRTPSFVPLRFAPGVRFMRCLVTRALVLFPLVTVAALGSVRPAAAQPPARPAAVTWHTDYNTARKEAQSKGLPLIVVIGTADCFYCRKLESGPLKDPTVAGLLADGFVALKLDATQAPDIAKALKVQLYPTTVLAGPDGKIHAFIEGYIEADRLGDQLKRTATAVSITEWATRDYNEASKALAMSDYPRAITLLKKIVKDAATKPIAVKAKQVLDDVEKLAAGAVTRAKALERAGKTQEAADVLADAVKVYAGTQGAADAATMLAGFSEKPEEYQKKRLQYARGLLTVARDDYRAGRLYDCMVKCERVVRSYADLPEAKEATAILTDIRANPERLAKACEQLNERTASMYFALADSWVKKGQTAEAVACLKKVVTLCPNTRQGIIAQAELARLQGKGVPAVPAGRTKP